MKYCPNCRKAVATRTMEKTNKEWQNNEFVFVTWISHHCGACNMFIMTERNDVPDPNRPQEPIIICTTS